MELTPRLKKIADLVPKNTGKLADIGTDHGYLPVYCVQNGIAKTAIAMDINEGPLARAAESVDKYGLSDKIALRLSDGIIGLKKDEADVIAIAGMGGLLIKKILDDGKDRISTATRLILQPMIAQRELREYLFANGYSVENEYVVAEGSKFYNIFDVKKGENVDFDEKDTIIGKNLKENSPEAFEKYAEYKIRILTKILTGMQMSQNSGDTTEVVRELEIFKRSIGREN